MPMDRKQAMTDPLILQDIADDGVGRLTLNRPEVHNAFNDTLVAQLTAALLSMEAERRVRTVVLAAAGKSFSAGRCAARRAQRSTRWRMRA